MEDDLPPEVHRQLRELRERNAELEARLDQQVFSAKCLDLLAAQIEEGFCVLELVDGPQGPLSDYRYLHTNAACVRHTGHKKMLGQTARQLIPAEVDVWAARFAEVVRSGVAARFEQKLQLTDRLLSLSVHRLEPASARQVAVIFKEVAPAEHETAKLVQLNEQLERCVDQAQAERNLFGMLVDSSLANVFVVDRQMTLLAINQTARQTFSRLHGFAPAVGDALEQCLASHPLLSDVLLPLWRRALDGEAFTQNATFDLPPYRRDYELRFNTFRDDDGAIQGAYLFAYDITERVFEQDRLRDTEAALRHAQKMEAVGQLTGGIAHDFNNLLGGIVAALELADQRLGQTRLAETGKLLEVVRQNASRAASLVQRLLAFSRRQTLLPEPTDVHAMVVGMGELIRSSIEDNIEIVDLTRPGGWSTLIDPAQLESALLNLCINARDAMTAGGILKISCDNVTLDEKHAKALDLPQGDYLHLCVEDNGSGMSAQVAQRAIEPFFTTKPLGQGTGLGLSMVYGFVCQSNGQLHIESQEGRGTRVHAYLPRHHGPLPSAPVAHGARCAQPMPGRRQRIMLVEDQIALRSVIDEVLEDQGYLVQAFDTGRAAMAALHPDAMPDLLISDIGLPGGVDGHQLAAAALLLHPGLKIIFITGYAPNEREKGRTSLEGACVLTKPFSLQDLTERVAQILAD